MTLPSFADTKAWAEHALDELWPNFLPKPRGLLRIYVTAVMAGFAMQVLQRATSLDGRAP